MVERERYVKKVCDISAVAHEFLIALLILHRGYFARAILEYPNQPMRSPFALSFLAAIKSAKVMLDLVRGALETRRSLEAKRPLWVIALSAAVSCRYISLQKLD